MEPAVFAQRVEEILRTRIGLDGERDPNEASIVHGVTFRDGYVKGSDPAFSAVVLFEMPQFEGCRFGWRWDDIWDEASQDLGDAPGPLSVEDLAGSFVTVFLVNLDEFLGMSPPPAITCDGDEVIWLGA
jgi:hypothetical protein